MKRNSQLKKRKGFTLVELIVVIGVLALLAVGAIIAFQNVQRNARIAANRSDATRLADAINSYEALGGTTTLLLTDGDAITVSAGGIVPLNVTPLGLEPMNLSVTFVGTNRAEQVCNLISRPDVSSAWRVDASNDELAVIPAVN